MSSHRPSMQGPVCMQRRLCRNWGMCAWGVFALAGITGVSKMAASAVHADSVALLQTAKPPIVASFDAAHLSATELRKRAGGIHIADSVERLQILRREQHTTRLEWLDAKKAVVTGEDSPDTRTSPFVGHSGLSAGDVSDSYSIVAYSPNGRLLVRVQTSEGSTVAQPGGSVASVIDTESGQLILSIRAHSADDMIQGVAFSPQGSYLVVSSRFRPVQTHTAAPVWGVRIHGDKDGIAEETTVVAGRDGVVRNNLAIWHVNTGRLSAAWCTHHHWNPDRWPYVHWRADENLGAWALPGSLVVFRALTSPAPLAPALIIAARLAVTSSEPCIFAVAPSKPKETLWSSSKVKAEEAPLKVAVFIPEHAAHRVDVLELALKTAPAAPEQAQQPEDIREDTDSWMTLTSLPMQGAEDVSLKWSLDATSLLVLSSTHVDETNEHYYGTTSLKLISRDKKSKQHKNVSALEYQAEERAAWHTQHMELDRAGPIHDVSWSPTASEFIVVYGTMPAQAVLYNRVAQPMFSFGAGPYNSVVWSPHGRFVCLGGFGNLAGNMRFWDASLRLPLGSATARCAIYRNFSPCSRYFLTAVTFPALRVDNELALWRYDGTLVYREKGIAQLCQAEWKPAPEGRHADRSASPSVLERATSSTGIASMSAKPVSSSDAHAAPQPFFKASFSLHGPVAHTADDALPRILDRGGAPREKLANGCLFGQTNQPSLSKSQLKRKKRKEKETAAQHM